MKLDKILLCTFVLALQIAQVRAEEIDPLKCTSIDSDELRLACFDSAFVSTGEAIVAEEGTENIVQSIPDGQQWRIQEETSALDGLRNVWLSVPSSNTEPNSIGSPIRATLWLRCMDNRTNVLIGFDRYTTDDQTVRYKYDDEPIQTQWMEIMRGGDGIGIWSGNRAIPFIRGMIGKGELVLAYSTYQSKVEFTFDVSGLDQRISSLAEACGWSL